MLSISQCLQSSWKSVSWEWRRTVSNSQELAFPFKAPSEFEMIPMILNAWFSPVRVAGHRHRLPRAAVGAPSLAVSQAGLDGAGGNLGWWEGSPWKGGGTRWTLRSLPTQPSLWFYKSVMSPVILNPITQNTSFFPLCSQMTKDYVYGPRQENAAAKSPNPYIQAAHSEGCKLYINMATPGSHA